MEAPPPGRHGGIASRKTTQPNGKPEAYRTVLRHSRKVTRGGSNVHLLAVL
jgi:hypothetical protein